MSGNSQSKPDGKPLNRNASLVTQNLGDHLLDSRLVEALDTGDFDQALDLWEQAENSPETAERLHALAKAWASEAEEPAGPRADTLLASLPSKGLSEKDLAAHQILAACPDRLPGAGGAEQLRIWMQDRGIDASADYTRHLWRQSSSLLQPQEDGHLMLAAREGAVLPPPPPEPPVPEGPVR
jgi:hypothetical protein